MGKNTPNRQKFIIENLRIEKDDIEEIEELTDKTEDAAVEELEEVAS